MVIYILNYNTLTLIEHMQNCIVLLFQGLNNSNLDSPKQNSGYDMLKLSKKT